MAKELVPLMEMTKSAPGQGTRGKKTGRKAAAKAGGFADALATLSSAGRTKSATKTAPLLKPQTGSRLAKKPEPSDEPGTAHPVKDAHRKTKPAAGSGTLPVETAPPRPASPAPDSIAHDFP